MLRLSLVNRQRSVRFNLEILRGLLPACAELCSQIPGPARPTLPRLKHIDISILSNPAINLALQKQGFTLNFKL